MGFWVKSEVGKVFSNHTHVALSSSLTIFILFLQLVEKLRCTLPLPNLFLSLARHFACCQSCSVSLRTLWAYGFDSAAQHALEKSKVGEKEKYFISFQPTLLFKKL